MTLILTLTLAVTGRLLRHQSVDRDALARETRTVIVHVGPFSISNVGLVDLYFGCLVLSVSYFRWVNLYLVRIEMERLAGLSNYPFPSSSRLTQFVFCRFFFFAQLSLIEQRQKCLSCPPPPPHSQSPIPFPIPSFRTSAVILSSLFWKASVLLYDKYNV
jgi:hypothetical protein